MRENIVAKQITGDKRKNNASPVTHVQGSLYHAGIYACSIANSYEECSDNGTDNSYTCNEHGQNDRREAIETISQCIFICSGHFVSQYNRSKYGSHIRTEKVGTHARYVTNVIPNVVGYGGGVARGIFGDICFYFTNKVGTHIGCLRIDTSAHAREKRDGFGSQ